MRLLPSLSRVTHFEAISHERTLAFLPLCRLTCQCAIRFPNVPSWLPSEENSEKTVPIPRELLLTPYVNPSIEGWHNYTIAPPRVAPLLGPFGLRVAKSISVGKTFQGRSRNRTYQLTCSFGCPKLFTVKNGRICSFGIAASLRKRTTASYGLCDED